MVLKRRTHKNAEKPDIWKISRPKMSRAAFLGRFQPFHKGHLRVAEEYRQEYGEFVLAVGSASKKREEDNPLSFEERKKIIRACLPEIEVLRIEDEEKDKEGNRRWAQKIEEKTEADVIVSGNDLVQRLVNEHTSMEIKEQEMYDPAIYSGTEVRRRIRSGEEWRYLVPSCAKEKIAEMEEEIKKSGIKYEFKPGWKKENAYHDTAG